MISYLVSIVLLILAWKESALLLTVSAALFAIAGSISMSNVIAQEREKKNE